ncbi:unnamed protein product [Lactuca virosa]|uniref:Uncharacterized protein n=1 Tax=Lactuca virosa TaxID=75947 RepID=A0AAU9M2R5_9ASTR|nr:unnamed protein product [Lactuca virosa]
MEVNTCRPWFWGCFVALVGLYWRLGFSKVIKAKVYDKSNHKRWVNLLADALKAIEVVTFYYPSFGRYCLKNPHPRAEKWLNFILML